MTSATIETFCSGDEWVRFSTSDGQAVSVETSDGEHSSVSATEAAERKAYIAQWGYRLAAT